jgi:hypothetical protein
MFMEIEETKKKVLVPSGIRIDFPTMPDSSIPIPGMPPPPPKPKTIIVPILPKRSGKPGKLVQEAISQLKHGVSTSVTTAIHSPPKAKVVIPAMFGTPKPKSNKESELQAARIEFAEKEYDNFETLRKKELGKSMVKGNVPKKGDLLIIKPPLKWLTSQKVPFKNQIFKGKVLAANHTGGVIFGAEDIDGVERELVFDFTKPGYKWVYQRGIDYSDDEGSEEM